MPLASFKPWLSFADQVALLEQRGMEIQDKAQAESDLERIGYYRLSGYFYPFRQHAHNQRSDNFVQGTQFQHVIDLYSFDNQIKLLALEAIQHIEIAMRVQIAYQLGQHCPDAHTKSHYFRKGFGHSDWLNKYNDLAKRDLDIDRKIAKATNNTITGFVLHNMQKYGGLPIWVACELWDFGTLSKLYQGLLASEQRIIERKFHLFNNELKSHLQAFNFIRNISAHHGRLWNRHMIGQPRIQFLSDKQNPEWDKLKKHSNHIFATFCLMQRMMKVIYPSQDWGQRFQAALKTFPIHNAAAHEVSLDKIGMGGLSLQQISEWELWN